MTIFKKLTIFKLIDKTKPDFLCEKVILQKKKNDYLPVAIANILTSEMLKMSLRAQSVMKEKIRKQLKCSMATSSCLQSHKGKSKWEGECGLWDVDGRIFLEKVAPEQNFENK